MLYGDDPTVIHFMWSGSNGNGLAQIKQRNEEECEEVCGDDEDCKLECLEEDRGEVMRDPDDRGLAQISNSGGTRPKGKGLAQISKKVPEPPKDIRGGLAQTGWFWDSDETSEDEKEENSRDVVADGHDLAQIGLQSDSGDSESEELSSEDSSFLSLAQIGQDSSSTGNENSEDAPFYYQGGSDAEDGGRLAQVGHA